MADFSSAPCNCTADFCLSQVKVIESDFFVVQPLFCEYSQLGVDDMFGKGSRTEIAGTLSNLPFFILGLTAFRLSSRTNTLVRLWCGMLCAIGVGSGMYHASGCDGCRMFDIIPMSMFAFLVWFYSVDLVTARVHKHGVRNFIRGVMWMVLAFYMVFCLAGKS